MKRLNFVYAGLIFCSPSVFAIVEEQVHRPVNIAALATFVLFMILTLWITTWAARRTRSRKDYYAAGGTSAGCKTVLLLPATQCRQRHFWVWWVLSMW